MPAATHMAASQLSSFHPQEELYRTLVYTVPYGEQPSETGRAIALGTLDLLDSTHISSLFGTGSQALRLKVADSVDRELVLADKTLDLVIMNPPFTRPTNHKIAEVPVPSFAGFSTTQQEQNQMSAKIKQIYSKTEPRIGHGNAGLASNFCDVAHRKLKHGGTLALVLPIAAMSGASWVQLHNVLEKEYTNVIWVTISSNKSEDRSFSADTDMAECLVVARKRLEEEQEQVSRWRFVSLKKKPSTIVEAVEMANALQHSGDVDYGTLRLGNSEIGQYITGLPSDSSLASIASLELGNILQGLASGKPIAIRGQEAADLKLVRLDELGVRGPVHRDVGVVNLDAIDHRGAFAIMKGRVDSALHPVLWWHNHTREQQILVEPDSRGEAISGREKQAAEVWETASRLHFSLDFNTNSASLVVCITPDLSLGGRAWPTFCCHDREWEAALALWGNSTIGLMLFWWLGSKQHSGRSINTITKLPSLLVLDPRQLSQSQLDRCRQVLSDFSNKTLLPASQAYRDDNRKYLDKFVLGELCGVSATWQEDFAKIRTQWCQEPIVVSSSKQ